MSNTMGGGGAVTPGAAADEVRVDCCLMTSDGKSVVTGSSLGPPQVWDMQVGDVQSHQSKSGNQSIHSLTRARIWKQLVFMS